MGNKEHDCVETKCDFRGIANQYAYRKSQIKILYAELNVLESQLMNHMVDNKQTNMMLTKGEVILKQDKVGMAEVFDRSFGELDHITKEQFDDIYTPETVKKVPAKINLQKLNKLKKYGADIWEKAEKCIYTKRFSLKYEEKKQ